MSEKHLYKCRACLKLHPPSFLHPLDDEDTRTLFEECSSVELKPKDINERHLCTSCLSICSKWNTFQELAVKSDSQLKLSPSIVPGQCRVCLEVDSSTQLILDKGTRNKFIHCTSILLQPGANEPLPLCSKCLDECLQWKNFKSMALNSDRQLNLASPKGEINGQSSDGGDSETNQSPDHHDVDEDNKVYPIECVVVKGERSDGDSYSMESGEEDEEPNSDASDIENDEEATANAQQPSFDKTMPSHCSCEFCGQTLKNIYIFKAHLKNVHGKSIAETSSIAKSLYPKHPKPYPCSSCNKAFSRRCDLNRHIKTVHALKLKPAPVGEIVKTEHPNEPGVEMLSNNPNSTESSVTESNPTIPYNPPGDGRDRNCTYCGKICVNRSHLRKHLRTDHGIQFSKSFQCDTCGKTYKNELSFLDHKRKHGETYACDECGKKFKTRALRYYHKRTHDKDFVFTCDQCGKMFRRSDSLKYHIKRQHTLDGNSFPCEVCSKAFPDQYNLKLHMRYHSKEKPFKCNLCEKAFRVPSSLSKHIRSHEKNKREVVSAKEELKCPLCEKVCHNAGSLEWHRRSHDKKPGVEELTEVLQCHICPRTYKNESVLKRHLRTHTKSPSEKELNKKYKCELCGAGFGQTCSLYLHHRRFHQGVGKFKRGQKCN